MILSTWLRVLRGTARLRGPSRVIKWPVAGALLGAGVLFFVLIKFSSWDVRSSPIYISMYGVLGVAWTLLTIVALGQIGVNFWGDVLERRNPAAAVFFAGVIPGVLLSYTGSNIGDGPGWWVVVYCSVWATGWLLLSWIILDRVAGTGEEISVQRSLSTAVRVAAWMLAAGMMLGRASAGDWISFQATLTDFLRATRGATGLFGIVLLYETWASNRLRRGHESPVVVPAAVYLIVGAVDVYQQGPW
jgi:hypothetical protein